MTELRTNPDSLAPFRLLGSIGGRRLRQLPAGLPDETIHPFLGRGIRKVAVVMLNLTADPSVDELEFARIFSTELERLGCAQVLPAPAVEAVVCHCQLLMPQDVQILGRLINVDAVILGFIRRYDVCVGPCVAVGFEVHQVRSARLRFDQVRPVDERRPLAELERVYDAGLRPVRRDLESFGFRRDSVTPPSELQRHPRTMTKYLHFVSNRMVRELVEQLR